MIATHEAPACVVCGKTTLFILDPNQLQLWRSGVPVQDAFPDMPRDDREQLITGTHPECWVKLFGEDDE